jgi:hypothetical protein
LTSYDLTRKEVRQDVLSKEFYDLNFEAYEEALKTNLVDGAEVVEVLSAINYGKESLKAADQTDEVAKLTLK